MIRGGSWNNTADNCRSAYRNRNTPDNRNNRLGFRVVLPFPEPAVPDPEQARPHAFVSASAARPFH